MTEQTRTRDELSRPQTGRQFAVFSVLTLLASNALAQDTTASTTEDLQEVVVTARYKEEAAQDVPIALSVIDRRLLDATGTFNVQQITAVAPTVQFVSSNPRNTAVNIRGFGSAFGLTNDGLEPGVGIYIDQVYHPRPSISTFDLVDIDRVEILRGPQGTLYGKNTTAGAINVSTREPRFTPDGNAEVTVGNYGFLQGKAAVTGPLSERVAGKLSIVGTRRDGSIDSVLTFDDINETNNTALNAQLLIKPSDAGKIRLIGEYHEQKANCCTQVYVRVGQILRTTRRYNDLAAGLGYAPPSTDPYDRLSDINSGARADQKLGGLTAIVDWDLWGGKLTSVSAYRFWEWRPRNDRDYTSLSILTASINPSDQDQQSQEFRFAAPAGESVDYIVGLYGFRQKIETNGLQGYGEHAAYWLVNQAFTPGTPNYLLLDGYESRFTAISTVKSAALFGQLNWRVTDRLTVTPGIRYTEDRKEATYDQTVSGGLPNPTPAQRALQFGIVRPQFYAVDFDDGSASGTLNVSFDATPDVLLYATYSRGFKSGGINLAGIPNDAAGNPSLISALVKPEKVTSYEAGVKSQWFDRRLTFNLAAFDTSIEDYQTTVVDSGPGALRGYLANIDKVKNRGIEIDAAWSPSDAFTSYLAASWNDGEYVSFPNAPCPLELLASGTSVCDLSGRSLPGLSKFAASIGGEYRHAVQWLGFDGQAYLGADASYRSKWYSDPSVSEYNLIEPSTIVNLRAGVRATNDWEAFVWVKNAFDEDYLLFTSNQSGNSGLITGTPGEPRAFGVTLRKEF